MTDSKQDDSLLREILLQLHESSRYAFEKSPPDNAKAVLKAEQVIQASYVSKADIEAAIENSYKQHQMNRDYTTDYQNAFLNGVQAMYISLRSALLGAKR